MRYLKKFTAAAMALTVCMCLLVSCGGEEKSPTSEPSSKTAELSGSVTIKAPEGVGYTAVSKLADGYNVTKEESEEAVIDKIKSGNYDFAVITPIEAAKLYKENGGFKAVTTLSLGNWQIAKNNYSEGQLDKLTSLGGYRIYALENDMSEEVLRTLMSANGRSLSGGLVKKVKSDEFVSQAGVRNAVFMAEPTLVNKGLEKNKDAKVVFDIGKLWQENFKSDIPGYILIVNDSFAESREDEVATVVEDISKTTEEAQKETEEKLTSYGDSNRGINLIKKFNKVMEKHNANAIGGGEVSEAYYFYQ